MKKILFLVFTLVVTSFSFSFEKKSDKVLYPVSVRMKKSYNVANKIISNKVFENKIFKNFRYENVTFKNVTFKRVKFYNIRFRHVKFINCNLTEVNFRGSTFERVEFNRVKIYYTFLSFVNIYSARFVSSIIKNSSFYGSNIGNIKFLNVDLTGNIWANGKKCIKGSKNRCILSKKQKKFILHF